MPGPSSIRPGALVVGVCLVGASSAAGQTVRDWKLDPAPVVSIGGGTGATDLVRIIGLVRLPSGHLVVGNGATREIRVFDPSGRPIGSLGRNGSGPGEFENPSWLGRSGDSVFVYDVALKRVTTIRFAPAPTLLGSIRLLASSDHGPYSVTGRLTTGEWLVTTGVAPTFDGPPGPHRLPESVGLVPADGGGSVRWLGTFPSGAVFVYAPGGKPQSVGPIAFSPWIAAVAQDSTVWMGDSATDSLVAYDRRFARMAAIRLGTAPAAPSDAIVTRAMTEALAQQTTDRGRDFLRVKYSRANLPDRMPAFGTWLVTSSDGTELWVPEYAAVPSAPANYRVFDRRGRPVGRVTLPESFQLHDAGADWVLGVHRDEDGLEYVRLYRLRRQ